MQAKKNIIALTFFLVLMNIVTLAQNRDITGKVLDAVTGQAVEFANLGITGTFKGDATDQDGVFSIRINQDLYQNKIRVSAVGYETKELPISRLLEMSPLIIRLQPIVYDIDEVDVEAPSRILYGMLKEVIRDLQENYVTIAYSADLQYVEEVGDKTRKLMLNYTDHRGYQQRSREAAFVDRSYTISEGIRNFEITPFSGGLHRVEELLAFDYLRHPGNVLDSSFVNQYEVYEKENYLKNGKRIMVIAFECEKPDFVYSGDARIKSLKGEIHMNRDNLSVLEISATYRSGGRFRHGRSFFVNEELMEASQSGDLEYSIHTLYEDITENKKALKSVRMSVSQESGEETKNSSFELLFDNFSPGLKSVTKNNHHYFDDVSILSSDI